ncbi:MAG: hypothetical protein ACRD4I_04090, partial [Candidatus Angelobacter sp.]
MNSKFKRARGNDQQSETKCLLPRFSGTRLLALALMTLLFAAGAYATPSVMIGDQGMNQPRGLIRVNLPGMAAPEYWVADTVAGFCRIDNVPNPVTGITHGVLNLATCYTPGIFEPVDYQAETAGVNGSNGYVFVSGVGGVTRLEFAVVAGRSVVNTTTLTVFLGPTSVFTNNTLVGGGHQVLPSSQKLGPDGKLYVTFIANTDIWRILNPLSPGFTVAGNKVERVGVTEGTGGRGVSMAWIGHDLWMDDYGFIDRIQNADQCNYTFPQCLATLEFRNLFAEVGMASDQFISSVPDGQFLYFANGSRVVRYDTTTADFMEVWNETGIPSGGGPAQAYSLILGINFIQTLTPTIVTDPTTGLTSRMEDMTIVNDPSVNDILPRLVGPSLGTGRAWLLSASTSMAPESCLLLNGVQTPPPCVNSETGPPADGELSPNPIAAKRAILLASGITHPRGLLFLQSNWWVSDEALGFCRIDVNPISGAGSLSNCFQPQTGSFFPGQADADDPDPTNGNTQNVYVPDASPLGQTIYRLTFTPDASGGTLSLSGVISVTNRLAGDISVVALPRGPFNDGALYVGYSTARSIQKITSPATAPSAPIDVAKTFNAIGVI